MSGQMSFITDDQIRAALHVPTDVALPIDFMRTLMDQVPANAQRRSTLREIFGLRSHSALVQFVLLLLLLIALAASAIFVASYRDRRPISGPVLTVVGSELRTIDPVTGNTLLTIPTDGAPSGVARSGDGARIAFWTSRYSDPALWLIDGTGTTARRLAENLDWSTMSQPGGLTFSPDGRRIAFDVRVDNSPSDSRLVVVDVVTGLGTVVGPDQGASPIFNADGSMLAFNHGRGGGAGSSIAIANSDGSGAATDLTDNNAIDSHGADSWSGDGKWIYFGGATDEPGTHGFSNANSVYRVNVLDGITQRLTGDQIADAPALSPDDSLVAYEGWTVPGLDPDLWLMNADGKAAHLLFARADIRGWSADGGQVLAEIDRGSSSDLAAIPIDGGPETVLLSADRCTDGCFTDVSWGFPRP